MRTGACCLLAALSAGACFAEPGSVDASDDTGSTTSAGTAAPTEGETTDTDPGTTGGADAGTSTSAAASSSNDASTGAAPAVYGLSFEGGLAWTEDTALTDFNDAPFTIELWFTAPPSFEGVLFDTTVAGVRGGNGMFLAVGDQFFGSTALAFQNLGVDAAVAPVLFGPDSSELAGWHHLAVTHQADGTHRMWLDGLLFASVLSPTPIDNIDSASIYMGSRATTPFPPLEGVVVDELRFSTDVLYNTDFAPARPLGVELGSTLLYWEFDEGSGDVATDAVLGMELMIDEGVSWVAVE